LLSFWWRCRRAFFSSSDRWRARGAAP
jgi:hypothetical protein